MPTAVPQPHAAGSSRSRQAPASRMPLAPSSIQVQLPPQRAPGRVRESDDLLTALTSRSGTTVNGNDQSETSSRPANVPPPPRTSTDVQLLASSLLTQQALERQITAVQETLIDARSPNILSRDDFKRALTHLSASHWLQVVQERALEGRCGYPTCLKDLRSTSRTGTPGRQAPSIVGRYRISVSRGVIERDTRDDAGGRNGFCSDVCHARSEWVRRWVLGNLAEGDDEEQYGGEGGILAGRSSSSQLLQGGKWEALTRRKEEDWEDIELLEDMQDRGELDSWVGFDESNEASTANEQNRPTQQLDDLDKRSMQAPTVASPARTAGLVPAKEPTTPSGPAVAPPNIDDPASRLANLTISERTPWSRSSNSHQAASGDTPVPRRIFVPRSQARGSGGDHLFDDILGGGQARPRPAPRRDDATYAEEEGEEEAIQSANGAAGLRRSVQQGADRVQAGSGGLYPPRDVNASDDDGDEVDDGEGLQAWGGHLDAETRATRETESDMLNEAMRVRQEMMDQGEWAE